MNADCEMKDNGLIVSVHVQDKLDR